MCLALRSIRIYCLDLAKKGAEKGSTFLLIMIPTYRSFWKADICLIQVCCPKSWHGNSNNDNNNNKKKLKLLSIKETLNKMLDRCMGVEMGVWGDG